MTDRSAARVAGILFIVATVAFSLSVVVLEPVLRANDYLASVSSSGLRVGAGTLLELINHIAVVGIAVVIFPILRRFSTRLAVGYVAARSIESVLFTVGTMHLLALANVSHAFVHAGAPPASHFHTIGDMLLAGHDWDNAALLFTAFGLDIATGSVITGATFASTWQWGRSKGSTSNTLLSRRAQLACGRRCPSSFSGSCSDPQPPLRVALMTVGRTTV